MVVGIGIDIVDVQRFSHFYSYSNKQLRRIFSEDEIIYCLSNPTKTAERLAARFAAKEALYKALTQANGSPPDPFLEFCAEVEIVLIPFPTYRIHDQRYFLQQYKLLLTMSHTATLAVAQVLVVL